MMIAQVARVEKDGAVEVSWAGGEFSQRNYYSDCIVENSNTLCRV